MVVPTLVRQALAGEPLTVFGDGSQTRSFADVGRRRAGPGRTGLPSRARRATCSTSAIRKRSPSGLAGASGCSTPPAAARPSSPSPTSEAYEAGFEDLPRRVPDIAKIRRADRLDAEPWDWTDILARVVAHERAGVEPAAVRPDAVTHAHARQRGLLAHARARGEGTARAGRATLLVRRRGGRRRTLAAAGRGRPVPLLSAAEPERVPAPAPWRRCSPCCRPSPPGDPPPDSLPSAALIPLASLAGLSQFDVHALRLAEALVLAVLTGVPWLRLALDAARGNAAVRRDAGALPPARGTGRRPARRGGGGRGRRRAGGGASRRAASSGQPLASASDRRSRRTTTSSAAGRGSRDWSDAARLIEGAALLLVVLAWSRRDARPFRGGSPPPPSPGRPGRRRSMLYVLLEDLLAAESAATLAGYLRGSYRLAGPRRATSTPPAPTSCWPALAGLGLTAGRRMGRAPRPCPPRRRRRPGGRGGVLVVRVAVGAWPPPRVVGLAGGA